MATTLPLFMDMHLRPKLWMAWKKKQGGFGNTEKEKGIQHKESVVKEINEGLRVIEDKNNLHNEKSDTEGLTGDNRYAVISDDDIKALETYRKQSVDWLASNTDQSGAGRRRKKTKRRKSRKYTKKRRTKKRKTRKRKSRR